MKREFLPIGSVVLLKNTQKRIMVIGRIQVSEGMVYHYSGILYPEGYLGSDQLYLFNTADIQEIYHKGYEDEEEILFVEALNNYIDKQVGEGETPKDEE